MACFSRRIVTYNSIPLHSIILLLCQGLMSWWVVLMALHAMIPFVNINIQKGIHAKFIRFEKVDFFSFQHALYIVPHWPTWIQISVQKLTFRLCQKSFMILEIGFDGQQGPELSLDNQLLTGILPASRSPSLALLPWALLTESFSTPSFCGNLSPLFFMEAHLLVYLLSSYHPSSVFFRFHYFIASYVSPSWTLNWLISSDMESYHQVVISREHL